MRSVSVFWQPILYSIRKVWDRGVVAVIFLGVGRRSSFLMIWLRREMSCGQAGGMREASVTL